MREDFVQPKPKSEQVNFLNWKTAIGAVLFIFAIWTLIWMKAFTPLVIYLGGFSLAILGVAFLLAGVKDKKKPGRNYKIVV